QYNFLIWLAEVFLSRCIINSEIRFEDSCGGKSGGVIRFKNSIAQFCELEIPEIFPFIPFQSAVQVETIKKLGSVIEIESGINVKIISSQNISQGSVAIGHIEPLACTYKNG